LLFQGILAAENPMTDKILITESVREVWQSSKKIVPTDLKIRYLNAILKSGFDMVDAGSIVSPKAIPQLADFQVVLESAEFENTVSDVMTLVVNEKGALLACNYQHLQFLSFPFSVSETFLKHNLNADINQVCDTTLKINEICQKYNKKFLCYITMGFGNPYGDKWHPEIVLKWIEMFRTEGIKFFNISDITGEADAEKIKILYTLIFNEFPDIHAGIHLHTQKKDAFEKIEAAWNAGVRHFDSVINGYGGCPMTGYEMLGNLDTFTIINYAEERGINIQINVEKLKSLKAF